MNNPNQYRLRITLFALSLLFCACTVSLLALTLKLFGPGAAFDDFIGKYPSMIVFSILTPIIYAYSLWGGYQWHRIVRLIGVLLITAGYLYFFVDQVRWFPQYPAELHCYDLTGLSLGQCIVVEIGFYIAGMMSVLSLVEMVITFRHGRLLKKEEGMGFICQYYCGLTGADLPPLAHVPVRPIDIEGGSPYMNPQPADSGVEFPAVGGEQQQEQQHGEEEGGVQEEVQEEQEEQPHPPINAHVSLAIPPLATQHHATDNEQQL